jgi:hydroxylaminobenzene mutase
MDSSGWSQRQGHGLTQVGVLLFLCALLVGLAVPRFTVPRLGLSAHLLGIMQGIFLIAMGLLWPRLELSRVASTMACVLAVYGCVAAWAANVMAAAWGAGNTILPIAAGSARGTAPQEGAINMALRSAALSLIAASLLILWGLRTFRPPRDVDAPATDGGSRSM